MTDVIFKLACAVALTCGIAACSSDAVAPSAAGGGGTVTPTGGAGGSTTAPTTGGGGVSSAAVGGGGTTAAGGAAGTAGMQTAGGGAGGGLTQPTFPFQPLLEGCDIPTAQQHADDALAATLVNFWSGVDQYVRATAPANGKLASHGAYAQVLDALLDGVERTGGQHYRGLVRAYYEGAAARGWLVDSVDDEASMTLALIRAFDLTADQRYLDSAEMLFQDVTSAWDVTCCAPHLGGVWSDKAKTKKTTVANAGTALAGVRLAKHTGKSQYLDFAKQAYAFWMTEMVDAPTFAVYDQLSLDGQRAPGAFTRAQGLMVGAALELGAVTGEPHYATEAHGFGDYLVSKLTQISSDGQVLDDGTNCNGDCAAYKGVGYRYLAELFRQDPTKANYRSVLTNSAKAIWDLARATTTDYFASSWSDGTSTAGAVETQSAAVAALNQYAMLCGSDPAAKAAPAGVYEAEESFVDHVDVEANKGRGFLGFGYVSAFTADKQGFAIDVNVAQAGKYSVAWRYTAGEGTCVRSVLVNGQPLSASQSFAATPSWTAWMTAQSTADLPAGNSTVELRFESAKGSKTSLDVDELTITPL